MVEKQGNQSSSKQPQLKTLSTITIYKYAVLSAETLRDPLQYLQVCSPV